MTSIERWAQAPYRIVLETDPSSPYSCHVRWDNNSLGVNLSHAVRIDTGTSGQLPDPILLRNRVMCHLVVDFLPDRGIRELSETLGEMIRFYSMEERSEPSLIDSGRMRLKISGTHEREPATLDDE